MIILAALMGIIGIIADVLSAWSETTFQKSISPTFWAVLTAVIIYLVVYFGSNASFEKILAVLVAVMGLALRWFFL